MIVYMLTFQKIIENLTSFWASKGCVLHTGCDVEVGAGTFNGATFLRALGPEPYSCAYVEPSRRPQDGRFGDNPNRLQLFHQFQVVIKPSPKDIQDFYLESLTHIGIDLNKHDVRFVHDDWESPTLGASGLGWEVWIDGMEVTQFTYFQIVAGQTLDPISVEITYGLERLCMIAQQKQDFFSMLYSDHVTYGEVFHRNEVEWSHYNFHHASGGMWKRHFDDFEGESQALIKAQLPLPAYEFTLKASHAFNMMEARGMLSVTERGGYIARVRNLAKECGKQYVETREKLGFPLLRKESGKAACVVTKAIDSALLKLDTSSDFLLEIGSEELPATFVPVGMRNLKADVEQLLKKEKIGYNNIEVHGTPCRLTLIVRGLSLGRKGESVTKKGPPVSLCFDASGNLTPQGKGFFASQGISSIDPSQITQTSKPIYKKLLGKQEYLMADVKEADTITAELLQKQLPQLIKNLGFPKKMRWGSSHISYARPLRWLLALFGNHVLPFNIESYQSSNLSWGHKQRDNRCFKITSIDSYFKTLEDHFVIVDVEKRRANIEEQLKAIESKLNAHASCKEAVMKEVLYLSEYPELGIGNFSEDFLKLPKEVSCSEMVSHQRYFPLEDSSGSLIAHFIYTADKAPSHVIQEGNERVLSARLRDGVFLYDVDLKVPLTDMAKKLAKVTFHAKLGSMLEKIQRMHHIAKLLAPAFEIRDDKELEQAVNLCKADLVSEMVGEFPELQGVIGKYYAQHAGYSEQVALAIEEHYCPKGDKAELPSSKLAAVVSISDRLDNLMAHFSIGSKPTSSSDPFALRRHAIATVKILDAFNISVSLDTLIGKCKSLYPEAGETFESELLEFIYERMKGVLKERSFRSDEIEAALIRPSFNPLSDTQKVKALHEFRKTPSFNPLLEVFKRAKGQLKGVGKLDANEQLLTGDAEKQLLKAIKAAKNPLEQSLEQRDYAGAFDALAALQKPLADFYDAVKILDDDLAVRSSRLALLRQVFTYFEKVLSFEKIQAD